MIPFFARHPFPFPRQPGSARGPLFARPHLEELEPRQVCSAGPATTAAPGLVAGYEMQIQQVPRGHPAVIFLGDSITYYYAYGVGAAVWQHSLGRLPVLDLGVPGQTTSNILWQVQNGLLAGTDPSWIVLMIGTNNLGQGQSPQQTADGIQADVLAIHDAVPDAHILVLGVLPSTYFAPSVSGQTNALVAGSLPALPFAGQVHFLDIGGLFTRPDGLPSLDLLPDGVHPSAAGYARETDALAAFFLSLQAQMQLAPSPQADLPIPAMLPASSTAPIPPPSLSVADAFDQMLSLEQVLLASELDATPALALPTSGPVHH